MLQASIMSCAMPAGHCGVIARGIAVLPFLAAQRNELAGLSAHLEAFHLSVRVNFRQVDTMSVRAALHVPRVHVQPVAKQEVQVWSVASAGT